MGFDLIASQPVFEASTAQDVKYPSYRGGEPTKVLGMHFEVAGAADTSGLHCSFFFFSWCNSAMSQALTDSKSLGTLSPPTRPESHLVRPSSPPTPSVWNTLSRVHRQRQKLSPLPVTQRHLLQSTANQSKAPNPIRVDLGLPGISFSTS